MSSWARSVMTTPAMRSAGQLAHQLITADDLPAVVSMFQSAGTLRTREDTGTSPSGVGIANPVMPWTSGTTPVATVVQMTGEAP